MDKALVIASSKGIGIPESVKFLLVESGIRNLGFEIRNTAQGIQIPLTIGVRNPSSTDKQSTIKYLESGIQVALTNNPEILKPRRGIHIPTRSWSPKHGATNKKRHTRDEDDFPTLPTLKMPGIK